MSFPARVPVRNLAIACLLAGLAGTASAQTGAAQTGTAQTGAAHTETLQVPTAPRTVQPMKPPSPVPRTPVRRTAETAAHHVPVVAPRKSAHPHKPETAAAPPQATPAPPMPPTATTPVQPPAAANTAAAPEKLPDPEKPEGAKLPRFASLRSDDVNMRAGPGTRYRIEWVYKRRDLPVEIEREYDVWRWVRDPQGIQGWVHQATLMGRRSFVVQKADATLRSLPSDTASPVAILRVGVIGRIRSCEASSEWCNVQAGSYRGYLKRDQFWGVLPGESINP